MSDYFEIVGKSEKIQDVLNLAARVAFTDAIVLILGESGTGKELFARFIKENSKRANEKFISINCAAIPNNLLENELFGHKRGAFTDAKEDYIGKFGFANGGTVFLDEIGEMGLGLQAKILRLIQFKEYEPIGGIETVKTNVRLITATNKNLLNLVKEGKFREDLYYRLNVIPVNLPSLRERKSDIEILSNHFLMIYNEKYDKKIEPLSKEVINILNSYKWPGNVRELQNVIERSVVLSKSDRIEKENVVLESLYDFESNLKIESLKDAINNFKRDYIISSLDKNEWNQTKTAKVLDIQRTYLARLIKELKIEKI